MNKIFGLGLATAASISLASCTEATSNLNMNFDTEHLLASSIYAIGGAIDSTQATTTQSTSPASLSSTLLTNTSLTNEQYEQISNSVNGYVDSVDKLMTGGLDTYFSDTPSITIDGIENFSEVYELTLSSGSYVVAYNITDITTEIDDDDEEVTTANLMGYMYQVVDGEVANTFDLVGFEDTETEEDEIETKFFIKATDNAGNYIKYHYSTEVENDDDVESESELKFKTSINGIKTYNNIEIEIENNKGYEVSIVEKLYDKSSASYESRYDYFRSLDDEFEITYRYRGDDFKADGTVEVLEVDGLYTYTFVNGSDRCEFKKEDHRMKENNKHSERNSDF